MKLNTIKYMRLTQIPTDLLAQYRNNEITFEGLAKELKVWRPLLTKYFKDNNIKTNRDLKKESIKHNIFSNIDTEQADYTTEFLIRDTVNDIVLKLISPGVYDIVFDRVDPTNSNAVIAPGLLQHIDYRTIPFFKLQYVFRKCFEEFGYTVSGDWIDDIDFAKLYLFNNFSLDIYSLTTYTDYNNMIIKSDKFAARTNKRLPAALYNSGHRI